MLRLQVLFAGPSGPVREAIVAILEASDMFELAHCVETADQVVEACRALRIDVLVLDEDIAGADARKLAHRLALERPIPTLLLVEDLGTTADQDELARRLRLYRLNKHRLDPSDTVAHKLISSRLNLLAARSREARATITRRELEDVLEELREEDRLAEDERPLEDLLEQPLELVLVGGTVAQCERLAGIVPALQGSRIPVIVAVEGAEGHKRLRERIADRRILVPETDRSVSIRKLNGSLIVVSDRRAVVSREAVLVGLQLDPGLLLGETLASMTTLGPVGLVVVTTPLVDPVRSAIPQLAHAGCRIIIVDEKLREAVVDGAVVPCMTAEQVGWLLGNATPRRV